MDLTTIISYIAIAILASSYYFQIWKIHVHKEVRDVSLAYHIGLAIGFGILTWTAYIEDSLVFMIKQVLTTIPVIIIIAQIFYHKDDRWHDDDNQLCWDCGEEIEQHWSFCAYCSRHVK